METISLEVLPVRDFYKEINAILKTVKYRVGEPKDLLEVIEAMAKRMERIEKLLESVREGLSCRE